jgi:hypothetical protein
VGLEKCGGNGILQYNICAFAEKENTKTTKELQDEERT